MNKKSTFLLFLLLIAVGFAYAQTYEPAAPTKPEETTTTQLQVTGTIDKIDLDAKSITLKSEGGGEVKVYTFSDATIFTKDGTAFKVDTLKVGDPVMLDLDDQNSVVSLTIHTKSSTMPEPLTQEQQKEEKQEEEQKD